MKKALTVLSLFLFSTLLFAQQNALINIIPQPASVKAGQGKPFVLSANTMVYFPEGADWATAADFLKYNTKAAGGFDLKMTAYGKKMPNFKANAVQFIADASVAQTEGYVLKVQADHIEIRASTAAGAFYAVQTLRQLFPPSFFEKNGKSESFEAPACEIVDYPRFGYRGMHLDVGRHFFPPEFVKRYIDLLAMHKMNRFHWHLTEDQGWRIEIKGYPKLQSVAACRAETLIGHYSDQPHQFDNTPYCGYYTQEEVKDIVEYARQRFVTIIPEIEMPGHSSAALAAYPELGCTGGPYATERLWGVFDDVYCAGNEKTFEFLDGVLAEVCALFPGEYIHIGGDESPKARWKTCPKCQKRIQTEGLKDEHELQSYFIRRAEAMVAKHGKKIIGWDEILEGGLAPTATVMSWRGIEGGIAAAQAGHDAIMTPGSHCYLDHYQSDPLTEPTAIGGYLPLEKVYSYEPIPEVLTAEEAKHILGAQGNVWTEYIATPEYVEYMAYPRAIALAEVDWSPKQLRNWNDFAGRLMVHFQRLDAMNVNYSKAFYDVNMGFENNEVRLNSSLPQLEIRYTTDGSEPSAASPVYKTPIKISQTSSLKAAVFVQGQKIGKTSLNQYFLHKASGKPYTMSHQPVSYTGGDKYALTNGQTGNAKMWSKWVGLDNGDIDPLIDLGADTHFEHVTTHFVNSKGSWIHPPKSVEVLVSDDGLNFTSIAKQDIDYEKMSGTSVETVVLNTAGAHGRYVKFVATSVGKIPEGWPGAGYGAWVFIDEVIVE